jgi:cytochrome c peroxidase
MYQTLGVMGDYFQTRGQVKPPDVGRFNATRLDNDRHVFKVPSLRNVAWTAPYFHDGSAKTLEEAVDVTFKYQLGRSTPKEDKPLIIRSLSSLTGAIPKSAP